MPLDTDLNQYPYWNDYKESDKYYMVLFRPQIPVQGRELNYIQSIFQNQVERFGNHVFKDGSVVEGCNPTVIKNLDFIRVSDSFISNISQSITSITSEYLLVGATSNVRAVAIVAKEGTVANYPNTNRFYVKYLNSGASGQATFANNEVIQIYNPTQSKLGAIDANNLVNTISAIAANASVDAVGKGVGFRIEDGIIYHKGYFQIVSDHLIIARDYDQNTGNTVIGFETTEEIINENIDENLLDNALGYPNYNAPGAHRMKLIPGAVAKERTEIANNDTFFAIYEFSNISNELVQNKQSDPYNVLGNYISDRSYDDSGDYVVKPFQIETISTSNSSTFAYQVSSGKAYVHGRPIEYLASRSIEADRAITTNESLNQSITANYGSYVFANQVAGILNFNNYVEVDLYDNTEFQAITNKYTPSFTGKSKVGTAKVKAVVHNEGINGLPETTYRIYLTNIVMNSGKSFNSDVKSIYANNAVNDNYGEFYADLANSSTTAVLYQSGKSSLVFPFGKKSLKNLRSANGAVNDTTFYYKATTSETISTAGVINVTIASPYTGGSEEVGYSNGVVGDTLEKDFVVTLLGNVSTANVSGNTVSITSGNSIIVGTNLNTLFANGEFIRITENTTNNYYRVIASNSSTLTLSSAPSTTNSACVFGKHFPAGYIIPLDTNLPGNRYVDVTSSTTFSIYTGANNAAALTATAPVAVQYRVRRYQAVQARKNVNKDVYVKLHANSSSNNSWNLGIPDVYRINKVYVSNSNFAETSDYDMTNKFTFDNGQRDDYYDHARLILLPQYVGTIGTNDYIVVKLNCLSPNYDNGIGFFSVDSYPTTNSTPTSSTINWIDIPTYNSFDLRDCVDFRAYISNTAVLSSNLASATLNPVTTDNTVALSTAKLVEPDTTFQADITYYLGRIDIVALNSTGGLIVSKGIPSENPRTPEIDVDSMPIAICNVAPWPSLTVRETEVSNRPDYRIKTSIVTNRNYTKKDIGVLDARIKRLEYYTTLNMLEQKAQNIQVTDSLGYNRFKNGIFADPMSSHIFGQSTDVEYRWAIDSSLGYGRPTFSTENIELSYLANTTSITQTGRFLTLPYSHEKYIFQPFATKIRNNTQDLWSWKGSVSLYPTFDMNRDETKLPNIDASIDLTQPFIDFANTISQATGATIFGTRFGDWRTVSSTSTSSLGLTWGGFTLNTTTTQEQERAGTNTFIVPVSNNIDLGRFVTDISVQPYIKGRTVAFIARNLKPNTRIYAYFDDTPVSEYCAPAELNTTLGSTLEDIYKAAASTGKLDNICVRTDAYGSNLISDENGTLYGIFNIPEGIFRVGDRQFQLLDTDSLITGDDAAITRASAIFTASNISVSTRNSTITAITPSIDQVSFVDSRVVTSSSTFRIDPIAQSFTIEAPQEQSGVFLTKLDLYFKSKDPILGLKLVICGMVNNFPDSTMIYGESRLPSSSINISDDASVETTFVFNQPIFCSANKSYAFYVEPEGGSPEYRMWMAETGSFDILTNAQVFKNPYSGDAFRSSNAKTWTALPKEDVKFNLYVANFTVGSGVAYFNNDDYDYITYSGLALANSSISPSVGDEVYQVNSASNVALITPNTINGSIYSLDINNGKLVIGSSLGTFANNTTIGIFRLPQQGNNAQANSTTLIATAKIVNIDNKQLHGIVPRFSTMLPAGTTLSVSYKGVSNTKVADSLYYDLTFDLEREMLDYERVVFSKSVETSNSIGKSLTLKTTFNNTNKYVSPVIDLSKKSALVIKNIINNNTLDEHTKSGLAVAKYISQPVTLADGQDAEDIKVYLSAYRPVNTEVDVYIKFWNSQDPSSFDSKVWTKLNNDNFELRSSPINTYDYKEFVYSVPSALSLEYNIDGSVKFTSNTTPINGYYVSSNTSAQLLKQTAWLNPSSTPWANVIQYAESGGSIDKTYIKFAIKIVLTSTNGIYVPKVNDVRAIALQV